MTTHDRSDLDDVARTWTKLGSDDPMWAVLTEPGKGGGRWDTSEFLATGSREIATVLERLDALDAGPDRGLAVDFGCGAGRLCHGLAEAGFPEVVGLDISPTMLDAARTAVVSDAVRFVPVRGTILDVPSGCADLIYTCRVLQHMPPAAARAYIAEFLRIVRPGGVVVFQLPTSPAPTPAGLATRLLPDAVMTRLRRGMRMYGMPEGRVRAEVAEHGGSVVTADPDESAGPRWRSRRYVVTRPDRSSDG